MSPSIIEGSEFSDHRGKLIYNNSFDLSSIKRIYFIENRSTSTIRAWQGHKIEQRWFSAVRGSFAIFLIKIDNWDNPNKYMNPQKFILSSKTLDVLHIPCGYVSGIKALETSSKLLAMADYMLGDTKDEYRFSTDYFKKIV